jgi:hypothetical protein
MKRSSGRSRQGDRTRCQAPPPNRVPARRIAAAAASAHRWATALGRQGKTARRGRSATRACALSRCAARRSAEVPGSPALRERSQALRRWSFSPGTSGKRAAAESRSRPASSRRQGPMISRSAAKDPATSPPAQRSQRAKEGREKRSSAHTAAVSAAAVPPASFAPPSRHRPRRYCRRDAAACDLKSMPVLYQRRGTCARVRRAYRPYQA